MRKRTTSRAKETIKEATTKATEAVKETVEKTTVKASEVIEEAKLRQMMSGHNPFELG